MGSSTQTLDHWQPLKFHISQRNIHTVFYVEVSPGAVQSIPLLAVGPVEISSHGELPSSRYSFFPFFFKKSCDGTRKKNLCFSLLAGSSSIADGVFF